MVYIALLVRELKLFTFLDRRLLSISLRQCGHFMLKKPIMNDDISSSSVAHFGLWEDYTMHFKIQRFSFGILSNKQQPTKFSVENEFWVFSFPFSQKYV